MDPVFLKFFPETIFVQSSKGVYFQNPAYSVEIKGASAFPLFEIIGPLLTQGVIKSQLLSRVPDKLKNTIEAILQKLISNGLLSSQRINKEATPDCSSNHVQEKQIYCFGPVDLVDSLASYLGSGFEIKQFDSCSENAWTEITNVNVHEPQPGIILLMDETTAHDNPALKPLLNWNGPVAYGVIANNGIAFSVNSAFPEQRPCPGCTLRNLRDANFFSSESEKLNVYNPKLTDQLPLWLILRLMLQFSNPSAPALKSTKTGLWWRPDGTTQKHKITYHQSCEVCREIPAGEDNNAVSALCRYSHSLSDLSVAGRLLSDNAANLIMELRDPKLGQFRGFEENAFKQLPLCRSSAIWSSTTGNTNQLVTAHASSFTYLEARQQAFSTLLIKQSLSNQNLAQISHGLLCNPVKVAPVTPDFKISEQLCDWTIGDNYQSVLLQAICSGVRREILRNNCLECSEIPSKDFAHWGQQTVRLYKMLNVELANISVYLIKHNYLLHSVIVEADNYRGMAVNTELNQALKTALLDLFRQLQAEQNDELPDDDTGPNLKNVELKVIPKTIQPDLETTVNASLLLEKLKGRGMLVSLDSLHFDKYCLTPVQFIIAPLKNAIT